MGIAGLIKRILGRGGDGPGDAPESGGVGEMFDAGEEDEDIDPFDPFPDPVTVEITDVFDLHSIPPREVRAVVEEYLREARRRGFRVVRIVHGKGVGVQREIVRTVLSRTPFVERFGDAPAGAGGWGATVAFLRSAEDKEGAEG